MTPNKIDGGCVYCGSSNRYHGPNQECSGLELEMTKRTKPTAAAAGPTKGGGRELGTLYCPTCHEWILLPHDCPFFRGRRESGAAVHVHRGENITMLGDCDPCNRIHALEAELARMKDYRIAAQQDAFSANARAEKAEAALRANIETQNWLQARVKKLEAWKERAEKSGRGD